MSSGLILAVSFAAAAGASLLAASFAVTKVEEGTEIALRRSLDTAQLEWADVQADGLKVIVTGTAPDETTRFRVLSTAGRVVDAARLIDQMDVAADKGISPPRFSVEILRNASGVSLIGLAPGEKNRDAIGRQIEAISDAGDVANLMEFANYDAPDGWDDAVSFALDALKVLPRSKISVGAGAVRITAMTESPEEKARLEAELRRAAGANIKVELDISAPRPVITPFTLRFVHDGANGRFDACSAPDEADGAAIVTAARAAGLKDGGACTIGLGVPTSSWRQAATLSIAALPRLGGGTLTITDTDIALAAREPIAPNLFDTVVGELDAALPDVFTLHASMPEPEADDPVGPSEFYATLSPEGLVQLRGRLPNDAVRTLTDSYARALFGSENVYSAARVVNDLPPDWTDRALAGLEALGFLIKGVVTVDENGVTVSGVSHNAEASAEISRLFTSKLGETSTFDLSIGYEAPPPPKDIPLTGEECQAQVAQIISVRKITFEPGSATIDAVSMKVIEKIAQVLERCAGIPIEIQGHTDSQGREVMNLELSQQRADAVLAELNGLRVRTASFQAKGYGEERPVAENDTEEGRETNRRIEFHWIPPEPQPEEISTLESLSAPEAPQIEDADSQAPPPDETEETEETTGDSSE